MFYPEKIKSIKNNDRVLEVGPGGLPHPRSDVFLDLEFTTDQERRSQHAGMDKTLHSKPVIFYDGKKFPFKDKEFDYVVCSHVLEHVDNVEEFLDELFRVANKGYLEFPTIYYDYLYNFRVHKNFLLYRDGKINWMKKSSSSLDIFHLQTDFFRQTMEQGCIEIMQDYSEIIFQGIEWHEKITPIKVKTLEKVSFSKGEIDRLDLGKFRQTFYFRLLKSLEFRGRWLYKKMRKSWSSIC